MFEIKHTYSPLSSPKVITSIDELTAEAFLKAINEIATHKCDEVVAFEVDEDNEGFADAFTSRGEIYSIERA